MHGLPDHHGCHSTSSLYLLQTPWISIFCIYPEDCRTDHIASKLLAAAMQSFYRLQAHPLGSSHIQAEGQEPRGHHGRVLQIVNARDCSQCTRTQNHCKHNWIETNMYLVIFVPIFSWITSIS